MNWLSQFDSSKGLSSITVCIQIPTNIFYKQKRSVIIIWCMVESFLAKTRSAAGRAGNGWFGSAFCFCFLGRARLSFFLRASQCVNKADLWKSLRCSLCFSAVINRNDFCSFSVCFFLIRLLCVRSRNQTVKIVKTKTFFQAIKFTQQ